jgi:hypothetical protein
MVSVNEVVLLALKKVSVNDLQTSLTDTVFGTCKSVINWNNTLVPVNQLLSDTVFGIGKSVIKW